MTLKIKACKDPIFIGCLVIAAWLCIGQVLGSTLVLLPCLLVFMVLAVVTAYRGEATPVLLFFLPWSPLLKLGPDMMTFYTFALIAICLVSCVRSRFSINIHCILLAAALFVVMLISKWMDGSKLSNSNMMFMFMLSMFPIMMRELHEKVDFWKLTLYFSLGIIMSALSAKLLVGVPEIARYINVDSYSAVTRFSGYYGDSNYYTVHVLAALGGVLLLFLREKQSWRRNLMLALGAVLVYCGFLSGSKSFFLIVALLCVVWFVDFITMKGEKERKILLMAEIAVVVVVILLSGVLEAQWKVIVYRFSLATDLSSLTTHRSEIWASYLQTLAGDAKILLLGRGMTNIPINGWASHNTLIQIVYQLGLIGTVLLVLWARRFMQVILGLKIEKEKRLDVAVLLVGAFFSWIVLDLVFFDEFFLIPLYVAAGLIYISKQEKEEVQEQTEVGDCMKEVIKKVQFYAEGLNKRVRRKRK